MDYQRMVRRIRQRHGDYPPERQEKAARVLRLALARAAAERAPRELAAWERDGLCPPGHWAAGPL